MSNKDWLAPWPEWSDSYVNETKWILPTSEFTKKHEVFSDPNEGAVLPPYMIAKKWRRPTDIYEDPYFPWIVEEAEPFVMDLLTNNGHLLEHKVMRSVITGLMCFNKIVNDGSQPDLQRLSSLSAGSEWRPWHHIYSISKIAKNSPSKPQFNPYGMYYVRLYFLGKWRRITVDDKLPFDREGKCLLPGTRNKCCLWPKILAKALLRIASLTWNEKNDVVEFSTIACLTGWIQYQLDCRSTSIDSMWDAILCNLNDKIKKDETNYSKYCLTCDTVNCMNRKHEYFNRKPKIIVGVIAETKKDEINGISPAFEHEIYFTSARKELIKEIENMPQWKKLRWAQWAKEKQYINSNPDSYLRMVKIYSPLSKNVKSSLQKKPVLTAPRHTVIEETEKISVISEHSLSSLEQNKERKSKVTEKIEEIITFDDILEFNFAQLYSYIRYLEIYFKPKDFQNTLSTNNLLELTDKLNYVEPKKVIELKESLRKTNKGSNIDNKSIKNESLLKLQETPLKPKSKFNFFLLSDSVYCKNIYITLSIMKETEIEHVYLVFENYNWKSIAMGRLLFGLKTVGTKTGLLQLGPGMQVCRVFCSLPSEYYITFNSESNFTLTDKFILPEILSKYSNTFLQYGNNMLSAFKNLLPIVPYSNKHLRLVELYKNTFYPPGYKDFAAELKLELDEIFDEVFEDVVTKYIFESPIPLQLKITLVDDFKTIFTNHLFGERFIKCLDDRTLQDIYLYRTELAAVSKGKSVKMSDQLNLKSINTPDKKQNFPSHASTPSRLVEIENHLFLRPETHIEILRKMFDKKPELLQYYPLMNDHHLMLQYKDYDGLIDIKPLQNFFVIARLTLNLHSTKAVPCCIQAFTEYPKALLHVIDTDRCERMPVASGLNATYNLKRNKIGYTILLCGYASNEIINLDMSLTWKIRVMSTNDRHILHICDYINPFYCFDYTLDASDLHTGYISGFYLPSKDNIIGRFVIGVKKSILMTLYLSVSNKDVDIRLILKGSQNEIIVTEGQGSIFVPVVLLDKSCGEYLTEYADTYFFFGTIYLLSSWPLTDTELTFAKLIRSYSNKDIISFETLCGGDISVVDENEDFEEQTVKKSKSESSVEIEKEISIHNVTPQESFQNNLSYCAYDSSLSGSSDNICPRDYSSNTDESEIINLKNIMEVTQTKDVIRINNKNVKKENNVWSEMSPFERNFGIETHPYNVYGATAHWMLSFSIDNNDVDDVFVDNDFFGYDSFKEFKSQWATENSERLSKGEELRKDFLDINKQFFMKCQLEPDMVSISDFSELDPSELSLPDVSRIKIISKPEIFPLGLETNTSHEQVTQLDHAHKKGAFKFKLKKKIKYEKYIAETKKKKHVTSISDIIDKSTKQIRKILFPRKSSSSTSNSYIQTLPPLSKITQIIINKRSTAITEKPIVKQLQPITEGDFIPNEQDLKNLFKTKKISFPTIYNKLVAPILWGYTNNRSPYCLKDLPVQAYSQERYSRKLEDTLSYYKNLQHLERLQLLKEVSRICGYMPKNVKHATK